MRHAQHDPFGEAPTYDVRFPPPHPGQRQIDECRARFIVANCGRRFGKTRYGVLRQARLSLNGKRCWWIAPTYKLARVAWRAFYRIALQLPDLFTVSLSDKRIESVTGGSVTVHSSDDPSGLRSEGLDDATLDEMAFGKAGVWSQAIRPALTDRKGSALIISTPFGKNHFFHLYQRALRDETGKWKAFHFPSIANPFLDPAEIEAAREDMSEREFRQEYLAEFLDDGGEVFRHVRECCTGTELERGLPERRYVMGVDWGKVNDYTVLSVIDDEAGELVFRDRFNRIDYTLQKERLIALHERFHTTEILAEKNSMGEPLIDDLANAGLPIRPFVTTNVSKKLIIDALSLAFERRSIKIYPNASLVAELEAYDQERLPGGSIRFGAPEGQHDDQVISLALAWHAARGGDVSSSGYLALIRSENEAARRAEEHPQ